jgi:hypothetical protein|nr:MAG TPA: hypothetical protein [Caudoviricetes sp.]
MRGIYLVEVIHMKEIQRTLKNYILKRLDTKTGIRSSKDIPELIYAYIELEHAQQGMANRPEVMSKIEVDKAGVRIQGKKINVNQNCQEAQKKEEPCNAKAQIIEIITNEIGKPTRPTAAEILQTLLK